MRVLCITSHRGSVTNVRPEAECFIGLQQAGVNMTVMTQKDSVYADRMVEAGIRLVDFEPGGKIDLHAIRFIRTELRRGHDIVHLFNNRAISNGLIAAIGLPVRAVTYRGQTGNVRRYDPTAYLTHLSPRVDCITCVAEAVRTDLIANGVPASKAVTIYKGHDLAWYRADPADLAPVGVPPGACVVAMVANARPRKGIDVLLEAARALPPDAPCHILLIGAGMERYASAAAGLPPHVRAHVLGWRQDAAELTAACQIAVLPALRREGLPKSIIEAMAYGVTPVVTDTGGNAELVRHGESGLVVPPGDPEALAGAIARLCRDPALRQRMGAAARARIDTHFNISTSVRQTLELYRRLLPVP